MAFIDGSVLSFLAQLMVALHILSDCICGVRAETLQISFGTSSAIAGYEVVSASSMFVQWHGGAKYFGSSSGGYWLPFGGAADAQSEGTALGTWSIMALDTFFCVLSVPIGSYQLEVTAGNTPATSSTCLQLPDGSKVLESTIAAGTTSAGTAVIHKDSMQSCLSIKACAADTVINVWTITRLPCHATCSFCTGASSSQCAVGCNEGRALVLRDGGSYCDARVPHAPGPPSVSAITSESLALSWSQPVSGGADITGYRIEVAAGVSAAFAQLVANTHSSATSFQVTGLASNTAYSFTVAAINALGVGDGSTPSASITTLPSAPDSPAAAWIENITHSSMDIAWSEPAKDGGRPITSYIVEIAEGQGAFQYLLSTSCLTRTLTDLQGLTTYRIRVIAKNEIGLSEPKEVASAVTLQPVAPWPPSIGSLSFNAPYEAVLGWAAPEDHGGRPVIQYTVSAGLTVESLEPVQIVDASTVPLSVRVERLLGSTSYVFQVTATNSVGTSEADRQVAVTPAPTRAAAPGTPSVCNAQQYSLDLTWGEPAHDGGSRIIGYRVWIEFRGGWSIAADCNDTVDNSTSIQGLQGNEGYRFRLQALTAFGAGLHSAVSALAVTAPVPPYKPGKPQVHEVSQYEVILSWDAAANDGGSELIGYRVWRRGDGDLVWAVVVNSTNSNDTEVFLQGLQGNTQYTFRVAGLNWLGIGHPITSDPVRTLPIQPAEPEAPVIENVTWSSIFVSWSAPTSDGGLPITGYAVELAERSGSFREVLNMSNSSELTAYFTGLSGATVYNVRVIAMNAAGTSNPSPVSAATTWPPDVPDDVVPPYPPDSPDAPLITQVTQSSMRVEWVAPSTDGGRPITGYTVEQSMGEAEFQEVFNTSNSSILTVDLVGMAAATFYQIRVIASNAIGSSEPSSASNATTLPLTIAQTTQDIISNGSSIPTTTTTITMWPNLTSATGIESQTLSGTTTWSSSTAEVPSNTLDTQWAGGASGGGRPSETWTTTTTAVQPTESGSENSGHIEKPRTPTAEEDACPLGMAVDGLQCVTECTGSGEVLALRRENGRGLACEAGSQNSRPARIAFNFSRTAPFPVDIVERLLRAVTVAAAASTATGNQLRFGVAQVTTGNSLQGAPSRPPQG